VEKVTLPELLAQQKYSLFHRHVIAPQRERCVGSTEIAGDNGPRIGNAATRTSHFETGRRGLRVSGML
jgi:hypothetical protein